MKKKILTAVAAVLLASVSAFAVFNEKDLAQTLSVLRYELRQEYNKINSSKNVLDHNHDQQHAELVKMMKKCNELGLILYSQSQDFTFDITYALKTVTKEYEDFNRARLPFDVIINDLDLEIDRYSRLIESLRRLPPQLKTIEGLPDSLAYHNAVVDSMMGTFRPGVIRREIARLEAEGAHLHEGHEEHEDHDGHDEKTDDENHKRPFLMDEQGLIDRDSCIFYATQLLKMYSTAKAHIVSDSRHYEVANARIKESYEYAQDRYKLIQKRIFIEGQDNYFKVLTTLPMYVKTAMRDASDKYKGNLVLDEDGAISHSEWRGPMVIGFLGLVLLYILFASFISLAGVAIVKRWVKWMQTEEFKSRRFVFTLLCGVVIFALTLMIASLYVTNHFFVEASKLLLSFAWLLTAILLSLVIRVSARRLKTCLMVYLPMVLLGFLVIAFRIIFIPNSLVNLIFPPILALFFFWQLGIVRKAKGQHIGYGDLSVGWVSVVVMGAALIISVIGYVLLSIQVLIWWLFQLSAIETLMAIYAMLDRYEENVMKGRVAEYKQSKLISGPKSAKGENIQVTWLFDFVKDALIPISGIVSVFLCFWWASGVFDLTEICKNAFFKEFVNLTAKDGSEMLKLSLFKIILVSSLYFLFKYAVYVLRAFYRLFRINSVARAKNLSHIRTNQINFTLADNIIGILVWGSYIILVILVLRIPMGAISIVAAGLATGVGLALKDILNNFIYGIQLMSGRLRVGDYIDCDGIRGVVDSISYQSTQIETVDGASISFLNTTLFNKNFKNLTRNNSYENVKIVVGVAYGTDIDKVRALILEALTQLQGKDRYGRDIVDLKRGVSVTFDEFGESSVDIAIKQFVVVSEKLAYMAKAKEIIYNTLNANGIEIPFPQRDVNIKQA